ncbi:hypothetical protein AA958_18435 [Streptomyces sp. CNQ-509]|uniref:ATP-binding protein n=1 Tax=Streptomyces sp. CNQ-509 TaxID=444103 RepID=UPI00062DEE93|nr:ATP-binding protein [Streptomyces sp. CNQ-509]AKH83856.1 hypothetical protein AA958_18435 [Streptomyces sp. CNQ-509]
MRSRTFPRSPDAVARARDFVAGCILGCAPEQAADIVLCVSELATNAVQHTPAGHRFLVRIIPNDGALRIEVHDASADTPYLRTTVDTDERGRGLRLVSEVADDWGVSARRGPGKIVWAEFKIWAAAAVEAPC